MMMLIILILGAPALVLGCSVPPNPKAREQTSHLKEVKNSGVSFIYNTEDFTEVRIEKVRKVTALDSGEKLRSWGSGQANMMLLEKWVAQRSPLIRDLPLVLF